VSPFQFLVMYELAVTTSSVNLGKWVLRNLFDAFLDEEIKRDETYRRNLLNPANSVGMQRRNAPPSIALPTSPSSPSSRSSETTSMVTPRPLNGVVPMTPSLSIGVATPSVTTSNPSSHAAGHLTPTAEEDPGMEKRHNGASNQVSTGDRTSDYFSSIPNSRQSETSLENNKAPATPGEGPQGTTPTSPNDDKEEKKKGSLFSKNFKMTFPKNMKLGRTSMEMKSATATEEKAEAESDKSSETGEKVFEDNLLGVIERIRHEYEEQARARPDQPFSMGITPSSPIETPVLRPPSDTLIIIQEDDPDSGGVADLYSETIDALGRDADIVEKVAPRWLGDLLLKVHLSLVLDSHGMH
jgi:WD repeat-containing protein 48